MHSQSPSSESNSAKILVTGASGFVGLPLVRRLLAEGERIRVLVRRQPPREWQDLLGLEITNGDLGDSTAVERAVCGCDLVYHLGAAQHGSARDFDRATVAGTRHIVEACLSCSVKQLVHISSLSVLHLGAGPSRNVTEQWPLEPQPSLRGDYIRTKLEAERIVLDAVHDRGLPAVVLRPGRVFGPGAPVLTSFVVRKMGGFLLVLGDGKYAPPLVYLDDLVDAILLAGKARIRDGRTYHIVDSTELSYNDLLRQYLSATSSKDRVVHIPMAMISALSLGLQVLGAMLRRRAPLSRYRLKSALTQLDFDCSAAGRDLGWRPAVGVRAGLNRTLAAEATKRAMAVTATTNQ